jgi:hypothetical protein
MGQMKLAGSLLVLVIMVMSAVGFAMNSANLSNQQAETTEIPNIINYELSPQEQIQVLRSGKVLIENFYAENCTECVDRNIVLDGFASRMQDFVVLENIPGNETRLGMIGNQGRIIPLDDMNITDESLLEVFCQNAIAQPRECLMMEY